jgi:hypothetical protein
MARFTTRVELHEANGVKPTYDQLHKEMAKENFIRTITPDGSTDKLELPTAEYNKIGEYTKEQVLESAKLASSKVWKNYSIIVTEYNGRVWHNLKKIN